MGMPSTYVDQYLKGAFLFQYENGFKIQLKPTMEHRKWIKHWFRAKEVTMEEEQQRHDMFVELFKEALPDVPEEKIDQLLLIYEDETTWLFWKHLNLIKTEEGDTFTIWDDRVSKEYIRVKQEESKKKEQNDKA